MVFKSRRKHILRAYKQNTLAIQPKKVGTLPHLTEPVIVCRQHLLILPCKTVLAGIQKDLPAAVRRSAANRTAVSSIAFSPHLRIPKVIPTAPFRQILLVKNRILLILLVVRSVTDRQTLRLYFAKTAVSLPFSQHAGIHQQLASVIHRDRTAGEAAVPVISFIRSQRRRKIFPVQKIVAHRMSPVHRSPLGIIRIILVEHMIFSAIIRKPIGIIQPARAHGQMKIRPFLLCYHLSRSLLIFTGFSQCLTCHYHYPTLSLYLHVPADFAKAKSRAEPLQIKTIYHKKEGADSSSGSLLQTAL